MKNSYELYKQALNIMPGGVNSPVRAFNAVKSTLFLLKKPRVHTFLMLMEINMLIMYVLGGLEF